MYLKTVEIQGFKSFADKTKLDFGPGITAVVGPNGSGKSNISDCIRWVLGEQSAKNLRGSKMEDVIFAGSPQRRPLSMAQVSLTLDNSSGLFPLPYQEVTVSRRVFRSGESEYLINKTPCRLKDIQELFNDTGLGKESFALIGQGKVEEVLNSRPEERRALIEEAAGIVKYRNRKKETLRKLEETEQNLTRVLDIIEELNKNLEPLKVEADKALKYKKFKAELDVLEIGLAKKKIKTLCEKLAALNKEIQLQNMNVIKLETSSASIESQLQQEKGELTCLEEELQAVQNNIAELTETSNKLEHLLAVSKERLAFNEENQQRLLREIDKNKERKANLEEKYKNQVSTHKTLQEQIKAETEQVKKGELTIDQLKRTCSEISSSVEELKNSVFDNLQKLTKVRNSFNQIQYEKESCLQKIRINEEKEKKLFLELEEKKADLTKAEEFLKTKSKHLTGLSEQKNRLKQEKIREEAELAKAEKSLQQVNQEIQMLSSRQQALIELQKDHEGYYQGVKTVLKDIGKLDSHLQGIIGVIGELILVPAEYEQAIEVALGSSIQNIVALDDKAAEMAINYLKRTNGGRATFLPLNTIKVRKLSQEYSLLLQEQGVIGLASDLVKVDPKYKKAVQHLLGNILVTDNLTTARHLSKKAGYNLKIVTLEGDIINPGGSLSGGSSNKKKTILLSRPRQIKELEKAIGAKKEELKELEQKLLGKRKNLVSILNKLDALDEQIQKESLLLATLEEKNKNSLEELSRLKIAYDNILNENEELTNKLKLYSQDEEHLKTEIAELEKRNEALEKDHLDKQKLLKLEEEKSHKEYEQLTSLKIKLAGMEEKEKVLQEELGSYYEQTEELEELIANHTKELTELEEQKLNLLETIRGNKEKLKDILAQRADLQKQVETKKSVQDKLKIKVEKLEKELREKGKELQALKEALQEKKVIYARLEAEKKNEEARLEEKFQISYEEIGEEIDDSTENLEKIRILKSKIAGLGQVNLAAIVEYERQKERYDFLKKQEEDLTEARAVLNKVIFEADQVMIKKFAQAFEEVNKAFGDIYQKLFGGGLAKLELTNPDDLLETGVDIVVQPPGKKLQNLSLLSGGERALTVIALLFALLSHKPSPFCVLDEIEASLDEVNVERFAKFLKYFAQKTQFIVISHRQGTIEVADALYGVTMEESGVSKIVSVKLTA